MNSPFESLMLRTMMGPMVAFLQLFGLYVVVHGHYSPGGGFQGGLLFSASFILPLLVYGKDQWRHLPIPSENMAASITGMGVLIFALVGMIPLVFHGQNLLDYENLLFLEYLEFIFQSGAGYRRSAGILLIEVGVTMAVAGAILSIFYRLYDFHDEEAL